MLKDTNKQTNDKKINKFKKKIAIVKLTIPLAHCNKSKKKYNFFAGLLHFFSSLCSRPTFF